MDSTTPPRIWFMVLRTARGVTYVRMGEMYNRLTSITEKAIHQWPIHARAWTKHCTASHRDRFGGYQYGNIVGLSDSITWHYPLSHSPKAFCFFVFFFLHFLIGNQSVKHMPLETKCIHNFTHELLLANNLYSWVFISRWNSPITCKLFQQNVHTQTHSVGAHAMNAALEWSPNNGVDRPN